MATDREILEGVLKVHNNLLFAVKYVYKWKNHFFKIMKGDVGMA